MRRAPAVLILTCLGASLACARREIAAFHVPDTRADITVERRASNPPHPEYARRIILRVAGRTAARVEMGGDTGGYGRANLYHLGGPVYLLRDAGDSYTVDVDRHTVARGPARRAGGRFLGAFDQDESRRWRFIPAAERPEMPVEFRGG